MFQRQKGMDMQTIAELEAELERYRQAFNDGEITPDIVKDRVARGYLPASADLFVPHVFDALKVLKDLKPSQYENQLRTTVSHLRAVRRGFETPETPTNPTPVDKQ